MFVYASICYIFPDKIYSFETAEMALIDTVTRHIDYDFLLVMHCN